MRATSPDSGDEPSDSQLEEARAHTAYPVDPESVGEPDGRKRRVEHTAAEIDASYRTQSYLLTWNGRAQQLSPGGGGEGPEARLHLLTAWNGNGRRYTYRQNATAQRRLRDLLAERIVTSAIAAPPDRRWFEELVLARDLTREEAVDLGLKLGQPAVVEWEAGRISVLPTSERSAVRGASFAAGLSDARAAAPSVTTTIQSRGVWHGAGRGSARPSTHTPCGATTAHLPSACSAVPPAGTAAYPPGASAAPASTSTDHAWAADTAARPGANRRQAEREFVEHSRSSGLARRRPCERCPQ